MLQAAYRLAFQLKKLPSEIFAMPQREFFRCLAYMSIEPPEEPANRRTASLMAQIANFAGRQLKDGKHMSADDYLGKPKTKQTAAEQIAFLKGLS